MDQIDRKLLQILSENAAATATEMVPQVNLSIPAINKRIQKLQKSGVIRRFTIQVDPAKVGKPICAYVFVVLQSTSFMDALISYANSNADVLELSAITGEYDCLLKVCAQSIERLDEIFLHLKKNLGIAKSNTMLSLTNYKFSPTILPND